MTVTLDDRWGGGQVSDAVAELLFRAQALAVAERSSEIDSGHLVRVVRESDTTEAALRRALVAGGLPYRTPEEPASPPRADTHPSPAGTPGAIPRPAPATRALLAGLEAWTGLTGDDRATTLHLLAGLAEADGPQGAELRALGLTAELVLRAGARHRPAVADEDAAFAPARAGDEERDVLRVGKPPDTYALRTRTVMRHSARLMRMNQPFLPQSVWRLNTPLGVQRIRELCVLYSLAEFSSRATVVGLVATGLSRGPWWLVLCPVLVWPLAHMMPPRFWLAARAGALLVVPGQLKYAVCCAAVLDLLSTYSLIRMQRVDQARPDLPFGSMANQFWSAWWARARRRLGE